MVDYSKWDNISDVSDSDSDEKPDQVTLARWHESATRTAEQLADQRTARWKESVHAMAHGEGDADASSFAGTLLPRSVRRRCVILPTREYVRAVPGETLKSAIATLSTLKWPRASHRVGVASSEYLSLSLLGFERETEDRTSTVASPPSPGQNARPLQRR